MDAAATIPVKTISRKRWLKGALFFLLIVLPGFIIAYYSYLSLRNQLTESILERKATIASQTATIVQERLTHITQLGRTYASKPSIKQLVNAGKWQEAIEQLKEIAIYSEEIDRIFLTDEKGTIQADFPALQDAQGTNLMGLDWYKGLVRNNWKPYVSNVYRRVIAPHIIISNASFPIKDKTGRPTGILVIQLHPELFKAWSKQQELEKDEQLYIIDKAGQIVSSPGLIKDTLQNFSALPAAEKALSGQQGVEKLYNPTRKEQMLTAYAPVSDFGWAVVLEQPFSTVFAKRNQSLASVLIVFSSIFLASIFFAWLVLYNITKLRKARESLRESEERYALSFEGTNAGLWDWDIRRNILYFSPQWKRTLGYTEAEFPNTFETWENKLPPEDWQKTMKVLQDYFNKKLPVYETEFRMRHKDGSYRWMLSRGMALWDDTGKPYRMVGSLTDLTERKKLEAAQLETQNFLDSIVRHVPIMLFVKDANALRFIRWNKAAEEITGLKEKDLLGKNDHDFFPKKQADFFNETDRNVINKGELQEVEEEKIETRFKGTRILHTKKIPIFDLAGKPLYLLGISEDITEKKKAEAKILELNNALAIQVKQLEKINQELKDVTHIISHDLKAPLRGIEMVTEWLLTDCSKDLDETCRDNILAMKQRVMRLHNLIDGILRYAQIGRTAGEKEELNLNSLIPEIVDLIAPPANIQIMLETPLPVLIAEKAPLQQLFQNLISNAVKYNNKPQGVIKIGATETEASWQFYVSDNGPGIEKEYFQRIFQLFQTLQPRDEFESTGIGLTIVKKIVENFGGKIWLESEPGAGTTFYFTLPKQMAKSA